MTHTYDAATRRLTVTLGGEIDHHSAIAARTEIDNLIQDYKPLVTVLVLSHIGFCDSSGLGLIMGRYKKMALLGGKLILSDPTPEITRIIALSGLDKIIVTERSRQDVKA